MQIFKRLHISQKAIDFAEWQKRSCGHVAKWSAAMAGGAGQVAVFAGWLALRYALDEELAEIPSSVSRT